MNHSLEMKSMIQVMIMIEKYNLERLMKLMKR